MLAPLCCHFWINYSFNVLCIFGVCVCVSEIWLVCSRFSSRLKRNGLHQISMLFRFPLTSARHAALSHAGWDGSAVLQHHCRLSRTDALCLDSPLSLWQYVNVFLFQFISWKGSINSLHVLDIIRRRMKENYQ